MIDASAFDALTFDCYGTLIDWERGILGALEPLLRRHGVACEPDRLLALYAEAEARLEQGAWRPYRAVLAGVVDALGEELGFAPTDDERGALAASMADWPPFPDTVDALVRLARRVRLGIVSNVDDDLFAATHARLGDHFTWIVTAEGCRAYKPSPAVFEQARERIGVDPARWLHAAQSLYHDVAPARALGLTTVHVVRRGVGATRPVDGVRAHHVVDDLAGLAALLGA